MSDHVEVLAGQILTAGDLQNFGGPVTSYIPVLTASTTNPTMGTGAQQKGSWSRHSGIVHGRAFIQFGTAGAAAGSGDYQISLPVPFLDQGTTELEIGAGHIYDSSAADNRLVTVYIVSGDLADCRLLCEGSGTAGSATPFTWANNDIIDIKFDYPADF